MERSVLRLLAVVLVACLGLGIAPDAADAASSKNLNRILKAGELRVGISGTQPPLLSLIHI